MIPITQKIKNSIIFAELQIQRSGVGDNYGLGLDRACSLDDQLKDCLEDGGGSSEFQITNHK